MIKKTLVNISDYQRQQVSKLIKQGIVTTTSEAVRLGLAIFIKQEKIKLWDSDLFAEYEAGMLQRHHLTGVLLSTRFQKDLNFLVKEKEPQLKRGVWVILKKIVEKNPALKIKSLDLKNYYLVDFVFQNKSWRILFHRHQQDVIACRISATADQVWFE